MNGHFNVGDVVLGNWTLVKELGEGSYGKVYEARRDDYGTYKSAIKIITIPKNQNEVTAVRAMGMDEASATSYFRGFVDRVAQEFALMSRLQGTANIVGYYDHSAIPHTDKLVWDVIIRMELLTPLLTHVVNHKMQNIDVVRLGIDMCRALEVCQSQNILHRDIKPENIFISDFGDYKLGDFGIARTLEATTGATKAGTYKYMAPEIYKEEPYNFTVDIYSLGLVLYQLLNNGRTPFLPLDRPIQYSDDDAALVRRMSGEMIPPPINADVDLSNVILRACAYLPDNRYQKPEQMRAALETVLSNMPMPDPTDVIANIPVPPAPSVRQSSFGGQLSQIPSANGGAGAFNNGEPSYTPGAGVSTGVNTNQAPFATPSKGGTVGMFGNREPSVAPSTGDLIGVNSTIPPIAAPSIGGTVGMYGDREPSVTPIAGGSMGVNINQAPSSDPSIGGTIGMYGNREPSVTPSVGGTVGMYGDRPNTPAPSVQDVSGSNTNNDVIAPPVVTDAEPGQENNKVSFLTTIGAFFNKAISSVKDLFQAAKDGNNAARKRLGIGGAIVVVLIAALIIVSNLGDSKTPTEGGTGTTTTSGESGGNVSKGNTQNPPTDTPALSEPAAISWSDWTDHLPDGVNANNSEIEAKPQYRSTPLIRVINGEEIPEGSALFESEYSEWSDWGSWQRGYIEKDDLTDVDTDGSSSWSGWISGEIYTWKWPNPPDPPYKNTSTKQYRKHTLTDYYTTPNSTPTEYQYRTLKSNLQYRSRTRQIINYYYNESDWSNYSDSPIMSDESTLVNYRTQYRYMESSSYQPNTPSMSNFPVFTDSYIGRFRDVDDDSWYGANKSNILRTVNELGIFLPDRFMRFNPDAKVTIGQVIRAAVMINRIYNGYYGLLSENNGDYQVYADYAVSQGIIRQGEFTDLTKEATRQEMAYVFYGALPKSEFKQLKSIDEITDMDMGYRYYDCALVMAKSGIINLNNAHEYRPEDTATRVEAASIIDKLIYPANRTGA